MEKDITTQKIKGGKGPSKIEDFSLPVLSHKYSSCFFWDLEDFPFPSASSPNLIYEKILEVLFELCDIKGIVSIWAYVDKDNKLWADFVGNKTWNSRIYFFAEGDKRARVNRMSADIILCLRDINEGFTPNVYVVSRDIISNPIHSFFHLVLCNVVAGRGYVLLYTGSDKDYDPEKSDWPRDMFYSDDDWEVCRRSKPHQIVWPSDE